MKRRAIVILFLTCITLSIIGCGSKGRLSGLVPGHGVVHYENAPLTAASITFHPVKNDGAMRGASALTDENGYFKLMTLNPNDGIAPGEYVVTVMKSELPPPLDPEIMQKMMDGLIPPAPPETAIKHLVNPKYADAKTSGINVTIGSKGDKKIELRLEK